MNENKYSWNLDDIVSLESYQDLFDKTRKGIDEIVDFFEAKMYPAMTAENFIEFTRMREADIEGMHRLSSRADLMESTNQDDKLALKLKNQLKDLHIYHSEKAQKISQWLMGKSVEDKELLDDDNARRLFASTPDLEFSFNYSRSLSEHMLTEKEENLIIAKDGNGISVINDLRDITETGFRFHFKPEGRKKEIKETLAEINALTYSPDAAVRKEAYRARFYEYSKNIDKFFVIYQAIVKDWNYEAKIRNYPTAISMRNSSNMVGDGAIETLVDVCTKNNEIFQRFFKYKAKLLGIEKLTRFDIYAPLGEDGSSISFEDAKKTVLEAFEEFSPDFASKAKEIIDANHIDSHPAASKRGGAFCATVAPSIKPYVLLNFSGKTRDVSTLAHELGHGVHSLYAAGNSILTQHPPLPLAETASTFAEMVLFEKLLDKTNDNEKKKLMLADKISDSYASIVRQNYFIKFEIEAHKKLQEGITEPELSAMWLDTLHDQFGDSVEVDDMFRHEWAYIPHIHHTPFYCYAYNFGELLSMALYKKYKDEGEVFIPKLQQILSAGGSEEPAKILAMVGVDMSSADFWQSSFTIIESWVNQLEQL